MSKKLSEELDQIAVGTILSPHCDSEQVCVKRLLHHKSAGDVLEELTFITITDGLSQWH